MMIGNTPYRTQKIPLFSGLPENMHKEFALAAHVHECKKGETIFLHGDSASYCYFVERGAIRVYRQTPDGKDVTLHIAVAGDMLGEHELFERRPNYQANATATEDSTLLSYSAGWIAEKIRQYPELALNMLAALSHNSSLAYIDKEHMFAFKGPQRIGCFLMRLCSLHELNPEKFILPYPKTVIASKLGMEPESFSRALTKLRDVGVNVSGNEISIADMAALDDYVCGACSVSIDCPTCENLHVSAKCAKHA